MRHFYLSFSVSLAFFVLSGNLFAQDSPIYGWKNYLPSKYGKYVTQSEDKVFFASRQLVTVIEKKDTSFSTLSKLNGLSNATPEFIKYIPSSESLIVTYADASFDHVFQNRTLNFKNLQQDGNFFNRNITSIELLLEDRMFFCTGYGFVEFDPINNVFGITVNFQFPITSITYFENAFYVTSEEGIYKGLDDPSINLKDLSNWTLVTEEFGLQNNYSSSVIKSYKGSLYAGINDILIKTSGDSTHDTLFVREDYFPSFLSTEGELLIVGASCSKIMGGVEVSCDGEVFAFDEQGLVRELPNDCADRPLYAIEDQFGSIWMADVFRSFRIGDATGGACTKISDNTPADDRVSSVLLKDDEIWLSTNYFSITTYSPESNSAGLYARRNGEWEIVSKATNSVMADQGGQGYWNLVLSPEKDKIYVGTSKNGFLTIGPEDETEFFNADNSQLSELSPGNTRVADFTFDEEGNIWVTNHASPKPLVVFKPDGTSTNDFSVALPQKAEIRNIVIDDAGYKWLAEDKGELYVYDDNRTIDIKGDDRVKKINGSNSNFPEGGARCIAKDLDGEIWVGTSKGVISFDCGASVFEENCRGFLQVVEVDGILANLLESEDVWSMAVDGGNRKWFGTSNGLFLMSPNGKEQLAYFNVDNSPLPDNFIRDIEIHPETGEVFIVTAKGLVSYKGDATDGLLANDESNAKVYPNPVRPEYSGPIAISGLVRDSDIKITDVNGQLIYQTSSNGGQAIWDGNDYNGRRAASGVYYIFASSTKNQDSPTTLISKVLFIN